ncbi:MAG: hypothetical protein NTW41_11815, partial [Verrucomicrobia bacterium]|nr:hypothetical protein [Verrucomicrobiota bacterium]
AGGTGVDTISITTAGETVADADFTDVDSVAALAVADGASATVTIDTEALAGGIVSLFGGTGDDTFNAGAAYDGTQAVTLIGGAGADSLLGRDQADSIVGEAGNDVINGRGGADNLDGGADNDTFVFSTAALLNLAATVAGGTGADTISITTAGETVADADFTDVDSVAALVVADGAGANVTIGTEAQAGGIVSLFGGTGADTFDASNAAYNTTGVYFQGNGGADSLIGGGSTDKFVFATSAALNLAATVAGGSGNDTISLTTHNQAVVDADFTDVLAVQALTFADGTGSSAVLAGLANTAGIASVYGGSGNDTLTVDETIYTGPTFEGADGTDVLVLSNNAATVTDSFFTNVLSVASFQTANGANDITLGAQATEAGIATVTGGTGNDILNAVAMTSAVTLMGGLGEDTLTGGSGGSRQQGWSGTASANTYRDTLTGGSGADSFVLGNAVSNAYGFDSNPATNYRALISGFDTGATDDVLVLNALGQSGALTVEASTTIANRMDIKMGGLLVYRFNYDNAGQTAALYVGDSTNVVAEFNNFTSGGQNLSTSNFQILG